MNINEIAYELTKSAIENNIVEFDLVATSKNEEKIAQNEFNAKQISDFYNSVLNAIKKVSN